MYVHRSYFVRRCAAPARGENKSESGRIVTKTNSRIKTAGMQKPGWEDS